jgi:hypothetical protein
MSYARLSKKPLLFRAFTGLAVSEFDTISTEIASKYDEHERCVFPEGGGKDIGTGRPFKLKVKDRFLMLLVHYRPYITYTLSEFLFDLNQSDVYGDISILESLVKLSSIAR